MAILSCMTLAIECDAKSVETVEGFAATGHPLIGEYIKHHAMQWGHCTPGLVVTVKALLDKNSDPTEEKMREVLSGTLCRCETYPRHRKTVAEATSILQGRCNEQKR